MNHRIASTIIALTSPSLKPTPTHTPTPIPTLIDPVPSPVVSTGNGLTVVLLIIVSLALVGVIVWIFWMFGTQRWITARSLTANRANNQPNRLPGTSASHVSQQAYQPYPAQAQSGSSEQQNFTSDRRSGGNTVLDREKSPLQAQPEDPLKNKRWLGLAEGCVELYDELDGLFPPSDPRQEAATHVMRRLQGILARSGVEPISHDRSYDIHRHLVVPPNLAVTPGTPIARIVSPGFAVGRRVIRPAQVQVASTSGENIEREFAPSPSYQKQ